jgi:hypothetical protein
MKRHLPRDEAKERADQAKLLRAWTQWHREQLDEVRAGEHGAVVNMVMTMITQMNMDSDAGLVACIQKTGWHVVDAHTRFVLLHEINQAIVRLREGAGLAGLDDPIAPAMNVFLTVKQTMFPNSPVKAGSEFRGHGYVPGCDAQRPNSAE